MTIYEDHIAIHCGEPPIARAATGILKEVGFHVDAVAQTKLILDFSTGHALRTLETVDRTESKLIVATRNPCPPYVEDLWELGPDALLSIGMVINQGLEATTEDLMDCLERGEPYRLTSVPAPRLNPNERAVLRYIARGWECQHVASEIGIQHQSVLNIVSDLYRKLDLHSHAQLCMYYWGIGRPF